MKERKKENLESDKITINHIRKYWNASNELIQDRINQLNKQISIEKLIAIFTSFFNIIFILLGFMQDASFFTFLLLINSFYLFYKITRILPFKRFFTNQLKLRFEKELIIEKIMLLQLMKNLEFNTIDELQVVYRKYYKLF